MKKIMIVLLVFIVIFNENCNKTSAIEKRFNYPDVLNIKNIPQKTGDWDAFCFSDLGAWFGFALPDNVEYYGSFIGPFIMRTGKWIAQDLIKFNLFNESKEKISFAECNEYKINYYPGLLKQVYSFTDFQIELILFYISEDEVIISAEIQNNSTKKMKFYTGWEGSLLDNECYFNQWENILAINDSNDNYIGLLKLQDNYKLNFSNKEYSLQEEKITEINVNEKIQKNIIYTYKNKNHIKSRDIMFSSSSQKEHYEKNQSRWNTYLEKLFLPNTKWLKEDKYKRLAVKSLETLILNWRCAADDLKHDGLFPSSSIWYFNGFWAWDSWKHSVALSKFAPDLAKDQVRTMFDYQNEKGMIVDCIYLDKKENNWRNSKPPLAAWAVWKIFEETDDEKFIREMFPKLLKYHQWWYKYRDHDKDKLCEYGSTDGTLIAAKWESGMDNAVRFDNSKIINNGNEWSINQESVDLNSYLFAEKEFLTKMAKLLCKDDIAQELLKDSKILKKEIQNKMFNEKTGFFYDINIESEKLLDTKGPESWTPLLTGLATKEQANMVVKSVCDTSKFATYYPFPTVSKKSSAFSKGYWRGTVWLDQACFGVMALRQYGYNKEADNFTKHLFDRAEGLVNNSMPIRENYWSLDGKGMNVNNFSWSAAHILMLLWETDFK